MKIIQEKKLKEEREMKEERRIYKEFILGKAKGRSVSDKENTGGKNISRLLGFILLLTCLVIYPKPHKEEISFLDVGQGDGIYICIPPKESVFSDIIPISLGQETHIFIDGGSSDEKELGRYTILPFLKSKDIHHIDYWFVSHADSDHISGLMEVLESGYEVRNLVVAELTPKDEKFAELVALAKGLDAETKEGISQNDWQRLIDTKSKTKTQVLFMSAGDYIEMEGMRIRCLYPSSGIIEEKPSLLEDKNDVSLVLLLETISCEQSSWLDKLLGQQQENTGVDEFAGQKQENSLAGEFCGISDFRALFAGDISSEVEEILLESAGISDAITDVYLYKVSHHGSKYSSSAEFLAIIQPEVSVISAGRDNSYGHPHPSVLERLEMVGSEIYSTAEMGQVKMEADGLDLK